MVYHIAIVVVGVLKWVSVVNYDSSHHRRAKGSTIKIMAIQKLAYSICFLPKGAIFNGIYKYLFGWVLYVNGQNSG